MFHQGNDDPLAALEAAIRGGELGTDLQPSDLTESIRRRSDIGFFHQRGAGPGGLQTVSPAGSTELLPPPSLPPLPAGGPLPDPNDPTRISPESLRLAQAPQQRRTFGDVVSNIGQFLSHPSVVQGLAAFGQAFTPRDSPINALGNYAVAEAQRRAEVRYTQRLLRGEDPAQIRGPDVAGITPEGLQRAHAIAAQREESARAERRVSLEENKYQQYLTQNEIENIRADRQVVVAERRQDLAERGFDLNMDEFEWKKQQQIDEFNINKEYREAQTEASLALAEYHRAAAGRQRRSAGIGTGGSGSSDPTIKFDRVDRAFSRLEEKVLEGEAKVIRLDKQISVLEGAVQDDPNNAQLKADLQSAKEERDLWQAQVDRAKPNLENMRKSVDAAAETVFSQYGVGQDSTAADSTRTRTRATIPNSTTGPGGEDAALYKNITPELKAEIESTLQTQLTNPTSKAAFTVAVEEARRVGLISQEEFVKLMRKLAGMNLPLTDGGR